MTTITVEIIYAKNNKQILLLLDLDEETTVKEAILTSGILNICKDIDLNYNKVGIFSKKVALDRPLYNGDRIEIYRPLIITSKELRSKRLRHKL
uniref:UPF0125 protein ACHINZ_1990 n=1 Tax=Candidatus Aschnera chinzeii TaxID=1485666 RepID=A0AAT9G495_9ENTR|nr:MAG: RnfH family protein [Candidatus Aschnera chinzeii]